MILDPHPNNNNNSAIITVEEPLSPLSLPPISSHELLKNESDAPAWKRILKMLAMLIIDMTVPLVIYFICKTFMDPMWALMMGGIPAALSFILRLVITRQINSIALLMFIGLVGTSAIALTTNDPKILLVEKSMLMGIMGVLHLLTLLPFPSLIIKRTRYNISVKKGERIKPFLFYTGKQLVPLGNMNPEFTNGKEVTKYDWLWEHIPQFRKHLFILTAFVGFALTSEFIIKILLIFSSLSLDDIVIYSNIIFFILLGFIWVVMALYIYVAKKRFFNDVDEWIAKNADKIYSNNNYNNQNEKVPQNEVCASTYLLVNDPVIKKSIEVY